MLGSLESNNWTFLVLYDNFGKSGSIDKILSSYDSQGRALCTVVKTSILPEMRCYTTV